MDGVEDQTISLSKTKDYSEPKRVKMCTDVERNPENLKYKNSLKTTHLKTQGMFLI